MIDGIINIYKESGYTSFDVVAKLRGILKQKKIGHTGTLDPMAEGVLIVCLGKATKLVDMLITSTKEYKASMKLGVETDTEDITGNILNENSSWQDLSDEYIINSIKEFIGCYAQLPPMYSAIKINGKKLYEYAREGIEIEREKRNVEIISINNIIVDKPYVSFDVKCSKGTYIRSLCRDIGKKLGCGASLSSLLRSELHGMYVSDAYKIGDVEQLMSEGKIMDCVIPMDALLKNYRRFNIDFDAMKLLNNGNKLPVNSFKESTNVDFSLKNDEIIRVYNDEKLMALYTFKEDDNICVPYKMFL